MDISRDGLYLVSELAEVVGITERTLQRLIREGAIPARWLGGRIVVRGVDLLEGLPVYVPGEGRRGKGDRGA